MEPTSTMVNSRYMAVGKTKADDAADDKSVPLNFVKRARSKNSLLLLFFVSKYVCCCVHYTNKVIRATIFCAQNIASGGRRSLSCEQANE